nr:T7SS effector LXG polymorphic toxin [Paucisalibacillus globulus]
MKVLDAKSLHQGISQTVQKLDVLLPQVKQIQQAIESFISLDYHFKGEGAEKIRSFYQECHIPLLILLEGFILDYKEIVLDIQRSLRSFDPAKDAFIRESFLQNDLMLENQRIENIVNGLTNEANAIIRSISDIVSVPLLDQGEFLHHAKGARKHMNDITENLHTFDTNSTARLEPLKSDIAVMQNYISKITDLFQQKSIGIANYKIRSLSGYEFHQDLITTVRNKAKKTVFSADVVLEILGRSVLSRFGTLPNVLLTAFQEKFQKRTLNYALRSMQAIGEASGRVFTQAEFDPLRQEVTNYVMVKDYQQEWDGIYFILKDGRKFRSFTDPNGTIKYVLVDEIRPHRFKKTTISKVEKKQSVWDNIASGAGKTVKAVGKAGKDVVDFLFLDDINTIMDDEASGADKALAGVSFIPIGKVVKLRKINKLFENGDKVDVKKVRDGSKGIDNANHPIRTYRNADLKKLEEKYTADPRITVEMPYVGKGKAGTNSEGWLRDKDFYWKEIMNKHPESLSKANNQKIQLGFSPINDKTFREHFPQYDIKELYNDKLIHHHVGGGGQAVAVPSKLHPGTGGIHNAEKAAGVWGNDSEYAELLEKFLNK